MNLTHCKHGKPLVQMPADWKLGCAKNYVCDCQQSIPLGKGKITAWKEVAEGKRKVTV